ncbi:hypothetical protein BD626DRAFT_402105 [Schizophyllum amplum]|uniref:Uncharacterized protein n=1 Tax=Schizophyllum amplum TaxID=97359 RepID=A0A550CF72_9AGAR|nr:hypothetical protein BD626DRAFT_402105 [Auriculariopsis ampla]
MPSIPSHAFSTCNDMDADSPIVNHRIVSFDEGRYRRQIHHFEYYWGLQKGDLHLSSPLNHIELRSDMVDKLKRREWVFMPTQETLKSMKEMASYNMTADLHSRRDCRKEYPDEEHEYDVVPLWMLKRDRPALYVKRGKDVKTFPAPYRRFPRIKSRAHPFLVTFMASKELNCCAAMIYPDKKARSLMSSVGSITTCWRNEPPASFLIGPDVWKHHRHPLSDDGHEASSALRDSRKGNTAEGSVRKTTRAPCRQLKTTTRTTPYAKCDMRPARARGSVLPGPGSESGAEGGMDYDPSDLRAWIDEIARQHKNNVSVWQPTSLDQEAAQDEELARYRLQAVRDAEDALHPDISMNGGGVLLGHAVDRSGYSSNLWAMRTYLTCLWAEDPQ